MCWAQSLWLCFAFFSPKKASSFYISFIYKKNL
ncbi:TetR/AcrR family transcriptional regulator, partial [Acinetobacter baumannii]